MTVGGSNRKTPYVRQPESQIVDLRFRGTRAVQYSGTPRKTATNRKNVPSSAHNAPGALSQEANLGLETHAKLALDLGLDVLDDGVDVGRGGAADVDHEAGVLLADRGAAHLVAA